MKKILIILLVSTFYVDAMAQQAIKKKVDIPGEYSTHTITPHGDGSSTTTIHCIKVQNSVCYTIEQCAANAGDPDPVFDTPNLNLINYTPVQIVILQNGYYLDFGTAISFIRVDNPLYFDDSFILLH